MTTPALNPAQVGMPSPNAANATNAGQAAGAIAGFDALMAALFPQTEAVAGSPPPTAPTLPTSPVDPLLARVTEALTGEGEETAEAEAATGAEVTLAATDYIMAPAPAVSVPESPRTVEAQSATTGAPKAAPVEAAPAPAPAAVDAPAEDVGAVPAAQAEAADTAGEPVATAEAPLTRNLPETSSGLARALQPPAATSGKPPDALATLTRGEPKVHANAPAKPTAVTVEAPTEQPMAPAAAETTMAAAPAIAAKPEPAPTPTRSAKGDRGKTNVEPTAVTASVDAQPTDIADAPAPVKTKEAVAATAQGHVEAVELKADEAGPAADAPDYALQAEARGASSASIAPAEPSAHPVRGSPETVANLAAQIIKKLDSRTTRFDLELDPHGLGKVDVRVEIGANGRITAAMAFENPQAAQDVKARANELQRALEQAGFDMSGGGLSFDVAQDRGQGQGRAWQQDQNETGATFRGQAFRAALETAGDAAAAANQGALRLTRGVRSGLDVRI